MALGSYAFSLWKLLYLCTREDTLKSKTIEEVKLQLAPETKARVATDTPVPIDVINIGQQSVLSPQTDLTQILNYAAPSFTSNSSTVADGTDHIDPAQLRGFRTRSGIGIVKMVKGGIPHHW